jgi:hypothetical protein
MDQVKADDMPSWLRYCLVHIVKRCLCIILRWIEDVERGAKL